MTQAVLDNATCPVFYESRVINLRLDEKTLKAIDEAYDQLEKEGATTEQIEKSKKEMSHLEELLGAPETIDSLCHDIIQHYEENRQYELTGKAMIVAYSRPIAMKIYHRMLELRPNWTEKVKVVITSGNQDPEDWHKIIGNSQYKKELAKRFKDNSDPMKIAIVVDMWLTGFDVPSLATMYVYKPMKGHNLMQAIARVNRVFQDKAGGLVVDYIGIAKALKEAMHDYTKRDKDNYGDTDIKKTALVKFREKLEICRDIFHGFDYSDFRLGTDADRALIIKGGVNYMMSPEKGDILRVYLKESALLHNAVTLCRSLLEEEERYEAAFFETVRTLLNRLKGKGKVSKKEINARIGELLKQSVHSDGVVNLFSDIKAEFSLFDAAFLEEISKMKEKNIAIELLKRLLAERVHLYQKTNVIQAEKFSDMLNASLSNYLKGLLTNEEVIQELLKLAKEIATSEAQGNELGLTMEEKAFYDALTRPQAVKDVYTNEQLVEMTHELTDQLRKNRTIDWQKKETARAGMRRMIKRLLKKYKYPPEEADNAMDIVLRQCEQWTDNISLSTSSQHTTPEENQENPKVRPLYPDYREGSLPLYSIRAACGYFGEGEEVEVQGWISAEGIGRLNEDLFVVQAAGNSMEPRIHDGDYCVFERYKGGSRNGKIVLAQHRGYYDDDNAGAFSIKEYNSTKSADEYGNWQHESIELRPLNPAYNPIVLTPDDIEDFKIIGEFVATL